MKQRSKAELLSVYKTYKAIESDAKNDSVLTNTTGLWRFKVEWAIVMLEQEHFTRNDVIEMFKVIDSYDNLWELDNEEELRNNIISKKSNFYPKNCFQRTGKKNDVVNATVDNMIYYNTKRATNLMLILLNWLIDNKNYGKKRIERDLVLIDAMDNYSLEQVRQWNYALREKYNIYIELSKEEVPEGAEVI